MRPPTRLPSIKPSVPPDWGGRILPTFRPDAVVNIDMDGWREQIELLAEVSGIGVSNYPSFIQALEQRRSFFKSMGAKATDHAALTAHTEVLTAQEAEAIFQRALGGSATAHDAQRFTGHMLVEMARMSVGRWAGHADPRRLPAQP